MPLEGLSNYPHVQLNAQRLFGPPADWSGPPPGYGTEVYIAKIPSDVFEAELISIFAAAGRIYQFRLIMHFSGLTKGFGYARYFSREEATRAVKGLNGNEIRPNCKLLVTYSTDNKKLIIQGIPQNLSSRQVRYEILEKIPNAIKVFAPPEANGGNKGYVTVEFNSHKEAASVRQQLSCKFMLFGEKLFINWHMTKARNLIQHYSSASTKLWILNLNPITSKTAIRILLERAIRPNRVARIYHKNQKALVTFHSERDAYLAYEAYVNDYVLDRHRIILHLVKHTSDGSELDESELSLRPEFMGAEPHSTEEQRALMMISNFSMTHEMISPRTLDVICYYFCWTIPDYKIVEATNNRTTIKMWDASVILPRVGPPLFEENCHFGPFHAQIHCPTEDEAKIQIASRIIMLLKPYVKNVNSSTNNSYMSEPIRIQQKYSRETWSNSADNSFASVSSTSSDTRDFQRDAISFPQMNYSPASCSYSSSPSQPTVIGLLKQKYPGYNWSEFSV